MFNYNNEKFENLRDLSQALLSELFQNRHNVRIAIHSDGSVHTMEQNNFYKNEIASVKCYSEIGSEYRIDLEGEEDMDDQEVWNACVKDGDLEQDRRYIEEHLRQSLKESQFCAGERENEELFQIIEKMLEA